MDIDFLNIDINPCPISIGNERPNYFESTARCKESTMVGSFNISYSFVEFINNDDVFCCVAFNKWFQQRQTYWVVQIAYHP